jgi:O-acetyl-ADP-ribose deacetylase (regulator of RNase III)
MKINYLERSGNILDSCEIGAILHQANIHHTMGAGMARQIAWAYPEALKADHKTPLGDINKLGTFSKAVVKNQNCESPLIIYNCYSQANYGRENGVRYTDYDAVREVFERVNEDYWDFRGRHHSAIGIPYGYGCGLGGGDWNIVLDIINTTFTDKAIPIIYRLN